MDKLAERSTQPLTRCWQTGREDSAEDNETCSRPPTDLRGSPCGMRQPSTGSGTVGLCSRSHRRSGILPVSGMRGKYGTQQSYREPSNRVFLSYDSPNHSGAAAPSFVDETENNCPAASGHRGQRWGKVKGRRFCAVLSRFPTDIGKQM